MDRNYQEAFVEVEEILKIMPVELSKKIPMKFRKIIIENQAPDYKVIIQEPLEQQKLKKETLVILGLIYRDFLCDEQERNELKLQDAQELEKIEKELQQKYDIQNVFDARKENRKKQEVSEDDYSTSLTLYEEPTFLKRLFNIIKGIFKKKSVN